MLLELCQLVHVLLVGQPGPQRLEDEPLDLLLLVLLLTILAVFALLQLGVVHRLVLGALDLKLHAVPGQANRTYLKIFIFIYYI